MRHANGSTPTADLRLKMQKTMQSNAAVFRDGPTLAEGVHLIDDIVDQQKDLHGMSVWVYAGSRMRKIGWGGAKHVRIGASLTERCFVWERLAVRHAMGQLPRSRACHGRV